MPFKADLSFLQKLTMGVVGTRATLGYLRNLGFQMIELERYSTSNKIWSTKVKRLRLPDILCARTGIRVEVRAKSDLQIRMSDSPTKPDRRWNTGLRDEDLVALVVCRQSVSDITAIGAPVFLQVGDLRASENTSVLGPAKSASEGAERDRSWPCIVPKTSGQVVEVTEDRIVVARIDGRRQTYRLNHKHPYLLPGDRFEADTFILASTVGRLIDPRQLLSRAWDPRADLTAASPVDRYAAAKAIPERYPSDQSVSALIERQLAVEQDPRIALELAGAAARMLSERGLDLLRSVATGQQRDLGFSDDLQMEAVFILAEIATEAAADILAQVARDYRFQGKEIRQAAVWGLGKRGAKSYSRLLPFLEDPEDDVALHATVAFGEDTPRQVVESLVRLLTEGSRRAQSAASEALTLIANPMVARELVNATGASQHPWLLATLGRLPGALRVDAIRDATLLSAIAPVSALSPEENWLARSRTLTDLQFLLRQNF